jgi:hypothetical protein
MGFLTKPCCAEKVLSSILSSIKSLQQRFSFSLQPFLAILRYVREGTRAARVEAEGFFDVDFLVWWGEH